MLVDPSRSTFCKRRSSAAAKQNMDQLETWLCLLVHAGSSAHWASLRNRRRIPVNEGLRMIARASWFVHQLAAFALLL